MGNAESNEYQKMELSKAKIILKQIHIHLIRDLKR